MSTQVEKRVLELEFDNKNFEKNIQRSMSALATFQKTIDGTEGESRRFSLKGIITALTNATKKFSIFGSSAKKDIGDIQGASDKFNMQNVASNLDTIASKFSAFGVIGMSVLNDLTRRAIDFGISMAKSVLEPIVQGGKNRAFNIENARFTLQGLFKDEEKVNKIMGIAQQSVEGTAYGFDEAAKAASQFAASGMSMDELATSLGALAGVTATFNADYSGMAHIFTTMSSSGRVMGHQVTQLATYGFPVLAKLAEGFNNVMQGAIDLGPEMNEAIRQAAEYGREHIEGFSQDLNNLTEADLQKLVERGVISFDMFAAIMNNAFGDQAKKANETFTGSMANIRAALARIGALFFRFDDEIGIIRQNGELVKFLNQVIALIDAFKDAIKPFAKVFTEMFNKMAGNAASMLENFLSEGGANGFVSYFQGIITLFYSVLDILHYLGLALKNVFNLGDFSFADKVKELGIDFKNWAEAMKPTTKQLDAIKRIASGVFAIFKILGQVIAALARLVVKLVKSLQPLWDVLLDVALAVSDWLVGLSESIDEAGIFAVVIDRLGRAFDYLGVFIGFVARSLFDFIKWVGNGIKNNALFSKGIEIFSNRFAKLKERTEEVGNGLDNFKQKLVKVGAFFHNIGSTISEFADKVKEKLSGLFKSDSLFAMSTLINEGLYAGLAIGFYKLLGTFQNFIKGIESPVSKFQGFLSNLASLPSKVGESLGGFFDSLTKGQKEVQPNLITKIAISIGILALSLMLIGSLDLAHMATGLAGLVGVMGSLLIFLKLLPDIMKALTMTEGKKGKEKGAYVRVIAFAAVLLVLSLALFILASAVKKMGNMDFGQVVTGLVGLFFSMRILVRGAKGLSKVTGSIARTAFGLILLGIALNLMVKPIKSLSSLSLDQLMTGLIGVAASLYFIAAFMKSIESVSFSAKSAFALILLATALNIMVVPVKKLSELSWEQLAVGLSGVGAILLELAGFMALFAKATESMNAGKILGSALALIMISAAIAIMAKVVSVLGSLDYKQLIQGLVGLAGILIGIGVFVNLVNGEKILSVAFAMLIFSGAMAIMSQAVKILGEMKLEQLLQGILALVAVLIIFGVAAQAMENSLKGVAAIAILALALVPLAFSLTMLAAVPFAALIGGIIAIAAVIVVFGVAAKVLEPVIPMMFLLAAVFVLLGVACLALGVGIGVAAWGIGTLVAAVAAGGAVLVTTITQLIYLLPLFFQQLALAVIEFFKGIANSWTSLKDSLITIARGLIDVFVTVIPEAVAGVLQFILAIVQALRDNIPQIVAGLLELIAGILTAIAENIGTIVEAGLLIVTNFINGVAEGLPGVIDAAFNLIISFIDGLATTIDERHNDLYAAVEHLIDSIVTAIIDLATRMWDGAQELWDKFKEKWDEFTDKAKELGGNIVNGLVEGIKGLGTSLWEGAQELGNQLFGGLLSALGISSPSTQFEYAGNMCLQGLIQAFQNRGELDNTVNTTAASMLNMFGSQTGPAEDAGKAMFSSIIAGFKVNSTMMTTMASIQANNYLDTFKKKSGAAKAAGAVLVNGVVSAVRGNSSAFSSAGATAGASYVSGIASAVSRASGAGSALANAVSNAVGSSSLYRAGVDAGNGFANGLQSTIARVRDAAGTIAMVAAVKIRTFLMIGSPSKLFHQYGEWSGEGLANGMADSIPEVSRSAEELAGASVKALSSSMAKMSGIDYSLLDIDAEPTITPVVDLTNVNAASDQLDSIFAARRMLGTLDSMAQSIAYSFSSREAATGINRVGDSSDATQAAEAYGRIADALETRDELTASEVRALREDVKAIKIVLDPDLLVGGLVANTRRRAAMNV